MASQESARGFDAVFSQFSEPDIDSLKLDEEVQFKAIEGLNELNESQKKLLGEALVRRTKAASEDKRVGLAQRMVAQLFEKGVGKFYEASFGELKDENDINSAPDGEKVGLKESVEADYDLIADTILGFKKRLIGKSGRRKMNNQSSMTDEEAAEQMGMSEDEYKQYLEKDPQAMEALRKMLGSEEAAKNFMNFYSVEYLLNQGEDSQAAWERFRKAFVLFSIPGGLDGVTYDQLMAEDPKNPSEKNEEMVRRVQAWQLMVDLLAVRVGPKAQVAQVAHRSYPTIGILGSTHVATMMEAAQKVEMFAQKLNWSTEEVADHLVEVTPSGNELAALLHGVKKPIVVEAGGQNGSFEIGVSFAMDQWVGNRAQMEKSNQGEPLYSYHGKLGPNEDDGVLNIDGATYTDILTGLSQRQRVYVKNSQFLTPLWNKSLSGRIVEGQQIFTWSDTFRAEKGKDALVDGVVAQIKAQGIKIEDIEVLWATGEDGKQLTKDHDVYRLRYQKVWGEWLDQHRREIRERYIMDGSNPDFAEEMTQLEMDALDKSEGIKLAKTAGAMNLIADAVVTAYGRYGDLGFALMDMFGETVKFDIKQVMDHLSELQNKETTGFAYDEKYAILPAAMRKFVQTYIRNVISWKRKDVDPVLVSLFGKKGVTAAWRDPLGPDKAPYIPEVRLRDGRRLSEIKNSKEIFEIFDGEKKVSITGEELYTDLTTTVEATFYTKSDWRNYSGGRQDIANHLVLLAQERGGDEGITQAMVYFDQYIAQYNNLAPQEFQRARDEMALTVKSLMRQRRARLDLLDWKEPLRAMGYQNMSLNNDEYCGVRALEKLTEMHSSNQLLVGEIQKMFKYMSKYPGMAVAEGRALGKIVPALNNAIHPLFTAMLGGIPDRMEGFNADQIGESLAKGLVNVLFMGMRNQKDAMTYVKEVVESTVEAMSMIGYMSGSEQRKDVSDVVASIEFFADKAAYICEYQYKGGDGKGEHGSQRDYLEIVEDDPVKEAEIVTTLRMAGFIVTYPNGSLTSDVDLDNLLKHGEITKEMLSNEGLLTQQLKSLGRYKPVRPYVTWGIQPQFVEKGAKLTPGGAIDIPSSEEKVLGLYGHKGKETLMTIILMEYLQDKMLMTELDASRIMQETVIARGGDEHEAAKVWDVYKREKERVLEEMRAADAAQQGVAVQQGMPPQLTN